MVYLQDIDYICDISEVRRLARNVVSGDFTDDQLKSWAYMEYSYIRTLTDKDDWDINDREFGSLKAVNTELTAADAIRHYGDTSEAIQLWQSMKDAAYSRLTEIVDNMDTSTGSETSDIQQTDYKSWNLNSLVSPPNRLRNVGITEVDF